MHLTRLVACLALLGISYASARRVETTAQPAASPQPGFDPKDAVRRVRSAHSTPRILDPSNPVLDDGEFPLDTVITYCPAPYDQEGPALAFDGTNFLVAWQDWRSGQWDIFGARVTPGGIVLDVAGIPISTAANDQKRPALAFDGASFLVVWQDHRSGSPYGDVYGARVTPGGTVLDTAGIPVSTASNAQDYPRPTFAGTNFLVTWMDYRGGSNSDIYGARVTPGGTVLDTVGILISATPSSQWFPALASDGTNSLIAWREYRGGLGDDIYGARVAPDGTVLDTAGIPISTAAGAQYDPALAFDGTSFFVTWTDGRSGSGYDIYGARVAPDGTVLDPSGISVSTATDEQYYPAVAFDGTRFLVAWEDYRSGSSYDIYGARVTTGGIVLDPSGIPISTAANDQRYPVLAFGGTNFLAAWRDPRNGSGSDVYGARVTTGGTVLDPSGILIPTAANAQYCPASAFDGTNYLVTWQDIRNGTLDIYGARVTPGGTVLDPSGFSISAAAHDQCCPALAFDGANYLVTWQDARNGTFDIYGARVTPGGAVLDPSGIPISTAAYAQEYSALAFDGANYLVTWSESESISGYDIKGTRVTPGGTVLDPSGISISTAWSSQENSAVAFDGTNYLVVWQDIRNATFDIYGTRVTPGGTVLDPAGIPVSTAATDEEYPALGFDSANYLVVWEDRRSGSSYDIHGARVTPEGVVLDTSGIPVSTAAGNQEHPALAFDGTNYLVTWNDARAGSNYEIYGARVTPGGMVFDSGPVIRQEGNQLYPKLCRGTGSQMFLVYQGWSGTVGGKIYNIQRIWGKMDPLTAIADMTKTEARMTNRGATLVRGVLFLNGDCPRTGTVPKTVLLDISGRKVLDLTPGANDVRSLAPGVYFVRAVSRELSAVSCHKVVVQR
jgi:hypothetical protein